MDGFGVVGLGVEGCEVVGFRVVPGVVGFVVGVIAKDKLRDKIR